MFLKSVTPLVTSVRTHLGYIPFEGRLGYQLQTNAQKFYSEHRKANLQPVAKVTYTFDPMTSNWNSLRNFMFFWQTKKVRATAPKLITKTEVVDDRREPKVLFQLTDGRELEVRRSTERNISNLSIHQIKTANLTELEIATIVNSYLLPLVKEVEETETVSKGAAVKSGGKGKKGKK